MRDTFANLDQGLWGHSSSSFITVLSPVKTCHTPVTITSFTHACHQGNMPFVLGEEGCTISFQHLSALEYYGCKNPAESK